jgi:hypothetical protein
MVCVRVHDCVLLQFLAGLGHVMSDAERFLVMSEEYEESGKKKKRLLK